MSKVWCVTILILLLFKIEGRTEEKTGDRSFKNVHLFKNLSQPDLSRVMSFIRASLGVHCDYCHLVGKNGWDFGNDSKAPKIKARQMIRMVMEINKSNFKGEPEVSCFTCHQGRIRPNGTPPLPQKEPPFPTPIAESGIVEADAGKILEEYVQATGGEAISKIRSAKTLVMKGTTDETWKRKVVPYEVYYKAPDKWRIRKTLEDGVVTYGFDGKNAWAQEGAETRTMGEGEVAVFRETIDSLKLLPEVESRKPKAVKKRTMNDRVAFALEYEFPGGITEYYYFDAETHRLKGRRRYTPSPIGIIPQQINYENYKELHGVTIPYTLRSDYVDPWIGGTHNFTEILIDVPLEDSQFQMPSGKQ